jgi:hypothetical protein
LIVAVLVTAGCTATGENPGVTPSITVSPTPVMPVSASPTITGQTPQGSIDDRIFLDATDLCYNNTPVIMDRKTNLDFTICMQHTPKPAGTCAQQFRSEILQYTTKDDDTTAGYNRETYNMKIARQRFSQCLGRTY